jgi:hypothetical protein
MEKYKEILKLKEMLEKRKIPFTLETYFNGYVLKYPNFENEICSVIEHDGSYGHDFDKLEIMGFLTNKELKHDVVCENLTAEDVFKRIQNNYNKEK